MGALKLEMKEQDTGWCWKQATP